MVQEEQYVRVVFGGEETKGVDGGRRIFERWPFNGVERSDGKRFALSPSRQLSLSSLS
jgi:hypothetical protein